MKKLNEELRYAIAELEEAVNTDSMNLILMAVGKVIVIQRMIENENPNKEWRNV